MTTKPSRPEALQEIARCALSPAYFAHTYCQIQDHEGHWVPFRLWEPQARAILDLSKHRLTIWLKARQLGMTWLALSYALHRLLFHPGSTVLLFSRRDDEARDLLKRLKGVYRRLPPFLWATEDKGGTAHDWPLSNGSRCLCFPTTAGDSYTASLAVVDEADLVPDLNRLLGSVKPTIDAGGRLLLLSRADKSNPGSPFKMLYRNARDNATPWHPVFLPWNARPDRDRAWYEAQKADALARTGSLDVLWEQYPETDEQALAANTLDKRIPLAWLDKVTKLLPPTHLDELKEFGVPGLPGLKVWKPPYVGMKYCVGADPAQGNPNSNDSALTVLNARTGEQVAAAAGKWDPAVFAGYMDKVGTWYNAAPVMCERNNHGAAVLLWLRDNSRLRRLRGHDKNEGWMSSTTGKVLLYDACTDAIREGQVLIHDAKTYHQLASIEGDTLRAPEPFPDDAADAAAFAVAGLPWANREAFRMESF